MTARRAPSGGEAGLPAIDLYLGSSIGSWALRRFGRRRTGTVFTFDPAIAAEAAAMGLSVETVLLKRIHDAARAKGVTRLVGEFIPTRKNGPTADFYSRHGFRRDGETDGAQAWSLDLRTDRIDDPAWIAVQVGGA